MAKKTQASKAKATRKAKPPVKKAVRKPRPRRVPPTPATNTEVASDDAEAVLDAQRAKEQRVADRHDEEMREALERQKRPSENT